MPRKEPLKVWLYDKHVATLTTKGHPGEVTCTYTPEALEIWPANTPLLSCSLLVGRRPIPATPFFRGLLPEGTNLQTLAARAKLPTYDTFRLLARYGRDVAGALVIGTEPPGSRDESVEPYDSETLSAEVSALPGRPLGVYDDSELSIAGLQGKLLLVALPDGEWGRPIHGKPSTHILKVEDPRFPGMARMEVASLILARQLGLTTIDATATTFGQTSCLIVSRFDREVDLDGTFKTRIHQEDACQALGRNADADDGHGKYERSGGPKLSEIAQLLDLYSSDAEAELIKLVEIATFNIAIGNADAHGKNIAFLHHANGAIQLAPLYDTVPTILYPSLRTTSAMSISNKQDLNSITIQDIVDEASSWPLAASVAKQAAEGSLNKLASAIEHTEIPDELATVVQNRCNTLLNPPHL